MQFKGRFWRLLSAAIAMSACSCSPPSVVDEEASSREPSEELASTVEIADRLRTIIRLARHNRFETTIAPHAGTQGKKPTWRIQLGRLIQTPVVEDEGGNVDYDPAGIGYVTSLFTLGREWNSLPADRCTARIQAVVGEGTFIDLALKKDKDLPRLRSIGPQHPLCDLILLVVVNEQEKLWSDQADFKVPPSGEPLSKVKYKRLGVEPGTLIVGFADGSVWVLHGNLPYETFAHFLYVDSAKKKDRVESLKPFCIDVLNP